MRSRPNCFGIILLLLVSTTIFLSCSKLDKGALSIVMSSHERHAQVLAEAFEKDTGVRTYMAWISSPETIVRLKQEKDNPTFSVWWGGTASSLSVAKNEGLLETLKSSALGGVPEGMKDVDGYWAGVLFNPVVFVYNPKALAERNLEPPVSWKGLLSPQLAGQVSLANPHSSTSGQAVVRSAYSLGANDGDRLQNLTALSRNTGVIKESGIGVLDSIASNEAAVGLMLADEALVSIDEKSPLKLIFPSEGTGFDLTGVAVVKRAKQPEQAGLFIEWAISKRAQELGASVRDFRLPVNMDARKSAYRQMILFPNTLVSQQADTAKAVELFYRQR